MVKLYATGCRHNWVKWLMHPLYAIEGHCIYQIIVVGYECIYVYSPLSYYYNSRQLPCHCHEPQLLGMTSWWKAFLTGLYISEYNLWIQSEFKTHENILSKYFIAHRLLTIVWAHALSRCLHCLWCLLETETPPPASAQIQCDHLGRPGVALHSHPASVRHNVWHSGQRETENWLILHFIHYIPFNFISCEQFTNNLLMAQPTSQQEAVLATLKEGWQTYGITTTSYTQYINCKGAKVGIQ